jgi:hypothetical protein
MAREMREKQFGDPIARLIDGEMADAGQRFEAIGT